MSYRLIHYVERDGGNALGLMYIAGSASPMLVHGSSQSEVEAEARSFYETELERQKRLAGLTEARIEALRKAREARAAKKASPQPEELA